MNQSMQNGVSQPGASHERSEPGLWDNCDDVVTFGAVAGAANPVPRSEMSRGQMGWLLSTIETEIIPRLVQAHRGSDALLPAGPAADRCSTKPCQHRLALDLQHLAAWYCVPGCFVSATSSKVGATFIVCTNWPFSAPPPAMPLGSTTNAGTEMPPS